MAGILEIKRGTISPATLNDGEFYLNKGINAVQIGSGSAILTLLPLNQLVSGDIYLNGNIYANNIGISSSYALSSSYSQYAATASYIISSSTSNTASYVLSSNVYGPWGFNSILSSSYAVTASYVPGYLLTSDTQSMLNSYLLISNTGSMLSPYLLINQTSSFINSNQTSSFVLTSQTSSFVLTSQTSSFVLTSQTGSFVQNSQTSSFVQNSQTSSFVLTSQTSSFVNISQTSSMTVATASYVSSSNVYGPWGFNSILSSSYAVTASLAYGIVGVTSLQTSSYPFDLSGSTIFSQNSKTYSGNNYSIPLVHNFFVGQSAGAGSDSNVSHSIIIGNEAGLFLTTGSYNTFLGYRAGYSGYQISHSIFIGSEAGTGLAGIAAQNSIFLGRRSGNEAYNSNFSIFLGNNSGFRQTTSDYSVFIGYNAGSNNSSVNNLLSNNIIIGSNLSLPNNSQNSINLGGILFASGTYGIKTGNPRTTPVTNGRIGINIYPINYNFEVAGNANISNGLNVSNVISLTGSLDSTGSVYFKGLTQNTASYILMYDSASGQLFYTASNALVVSGSGGTGSGFPFSGSAVITGSLTISGSLTVLGTASFVSTSIIYASGSNQFGDTIDDTQTLIGTVIVSGSQQITGSLNVSAGITGSLFGTASNVAGGQKNYIAVWNDNITLTTGSLYQTGSFIGINTTTPRFTLEVSGSAQITNYVKIGDIPFPTWTTTTGSRFDAIDYIKNPTTNPQESMGRWTRSMYGSSSFTDFSNNRFEIVNFGRNLELAPGQTYNIASTDWNARKVALGAGLGIGVSGSGTSPNTIYNSGYTLAGTNYAILGKIDFWPEFDEGTLRRDYNGQYSVIGGHIDFTAGSGSTAETLMFYSAGGFKSLVSASVTNLYNYYSGLETESFSTSRIKNIYGFYSAPLYRSYATQSYGFYQSGSSDINFFEGKVGIGIKSPTNNLHIAGTTLISASAETTPLTIIGSASINTPLVFVSGSNGQLLNIFDNLSGSIFEVNNQSGNPILEVNSDNTIKFGLWPVPANHTSYKTIITSGSSPFTIFTIPTASADCAFFDYMISSGSNIRAGTFVSNWYLSNINYIETSTDDIGNTNYVTMSADINGENFRFLGQSSFGDWVIKTIIRYI